MGGIVEVRVPDNDALQREVAAAISRAQSEDPFAPVTLVVDAADQAWALRRQLAQRAAPGTGVANVRATTVSEFLASLADLLKVTGPTTAEPLLEAAVVEALLRDQVGPLSASADHPETAARLADLAEALAWCPLDDQSVESLAAHGISLTARTAISFAQQARSAFASALGRPGRPQLASVMCRALEKPSTGVDLGMVVVATTRLPTPVADVLHALADHVPVVRLITAPESVPIPAEVLDFPDPDTECRFAVRLAADAIDRGTSPGRVAILYSAEAPYARLVERALDDAEVAWHGPTGQTLRSTTAARCLFALVDLARARTASDSGITRPLLMRLLGLGHLADGPAPVAAGATRALIRQEGLFDDARDWLGHLAAIAPPARGTDDVDVEEPEAAGSRHVRGLTPHARPLAEFIRALDGVLDAIATATTWAGLGTALWTAFESFHLRGAWWTVRPQDVAAVDASRALLLESFPAIDALAAHAPEASAATAASMLDQSLAARRARHGASSIGLHVGPVSSARGLVFDRVVLIGASEGLLPPIRGEDPILPDSARTLLRRSADDLPTSTETELMAAGDLRAVVAAAGSCTALLSRAALPGRAVGLPSRYLPPGHPDRVESARSSLGREPGPIAVSDLAERGALVSPTPDPVLLPRIESIAAWSRPAPGPHFGDVAAAAHRWSVADRSLSASAIEQFLHCPYHFFVQRILGFSTDEFEDTIDTIAPNDLGTLVHRALETFVVQSRERGTLPEPGGSWPRSALADLRQIVDDQAAAATAKGLTGWAPAWRRNYDRLVDSLPSFLEVDSAVVRAEPPTAPVSAEQHFGDEGSPVVEFRLSDDVVVRLRGAIDRVDRSADGSAVGIVDYKSGRSSGFAEKLGKPRNDGSPRDRQRVQDLVYDAAARVLFPGADRVDVHFLFVPNGGDGPAVVTPTHDEDRESVLRDLVGRMEAAGRAGRFPPTPRGSRDYCPVCQRLGRRAAIVSGGTDSEDAEEQP